MYNKTINKINEQGKESESATSPQKYSGGVADAKLDYLNDLYDAIVNTVYNLDGDNMSEDFLNALKFNEESDI